MRFVPYPAVDFFRRSHVYAEKLFTGTWLNSVPKFLALFPAQWQENMSEALTDVRWHYGFWGQFITARGVFNAVV